MCRCRFIYKTAAVSLLIAPFFLTSIAFKMPEVYIPEAKEALYSVRYIFTTLAIWNLQPLFCQKYLVTSALNTCVTAYQVESLHLAFNNEI